jgi:hypothetical protein
MKGRFLVKVQIWIIGYRLKKSRNGKHKQTGWDISGGGRLYLSFHLKWSKLSVHFYSYEEMKKKFKKFVTVRL